MLITYNFCYPFWYDLLFATHSCPLRTGHLSIYISYESVSLFVSVHV